MHTTHPKLGKFNGFQFGEMYNEMHKIRFHFSCEVAQFINLSIQECRSILDRYSEEQAREVQKIKEK